MKLLIVDTFYGPYLQRLYADGSLGAKPWSEQHTAHFRGGFGTGDAYSHGLGLLGVPAIEIVANSAPLQRAWAREHRPELLQIQDEAQQLMAILEAQICWWQPTVLYVQDVNWLPAPFLKYVNQLVQMVVGQNACPLAPNLDLSPYDLVLTSLPHYVGRFRKQGVDAAYFPIGFDERLLQRHRTESQRSHLLTFVGGLGGYHSQGTQMLEALAQELPLQVWGYGGSQLPTGSTLKQRWQGEAWADDMYNLLANSQITINRHIDIAENFACNMRLYEATGMGACLITEHKSNISDIFEPDKEIVTFNSAMEAVAKVKELIDKPDLVRRIAEAGQARTIKEYSYSKRMEMLVDILSRHRPAMVSNLISEPRSHSKPKLNIPVYAKSDSFEMARNWANKLRKRSTERHFNFHFIVDKRIDSMGESVWMPLLQDPDQNLVESYFNCVTASGVAIIIESDLLVNDSTRLAFHSEAIKHGLAVKTIRLES